MWRPVLEYLYFVWEIRVSKRNSRGVLQGVKCVAVLKKGGKKRKRGALLWRICISFGRFASRRGTAAVCCSFASQKANALQCLKKKTRECGALS